VAEGGMLNGVSFYDYYKTQDGRYLSIGSLEPQFMLGLATALQLPILAEKGASMLTEDRQAVRAAIADAIVSQSFAHWQQVFAALDVCVEPVLSLAEAVQSDLAQQRGWLVDVPLVAGEASTQKQLAHPIKFSRSQPVYRFVGRELGADNQTIQSKP
ncbi:MAG: CoA transferase, partial [Flavobacteriales bacterium]